MSMDDISAFLEQNKDSLIQNGVTWVGQQRAIYRPNAIPLADKDRTALLNFFDADTLDRARFTLVSGIENPPFYRELPERIQQRLLNFTTMDGITFHDTVLIANRLIISGAIPRSLVFHELVHVVQYRVLGILGFVTNYVNGWITNNFEYDAIPLEHDAYALQHIYEGNPNHSFSVEREVLRRLN